MGINKKIVLFLLCISSLFVKDLPAERPKICLTMIVKNEEKIIERCLNSAKDAIDYVAICDTGSTDKTIQIIEQFLIKNKIPGKVYSHNWKNFGYNRTFSVNAAKMMLTDFGVPLNQAFLLLLDADMLLEVKDGFENERFLADSYLFAQKNQCISYFNTRLIRAGLPWQCVGVTHEYWSSKVPSKEEKMVTLSIDDRNDGGCKSDKFERDIMLLEQGLKDEPGNERYMFYLAQSYKNSGKYNEAIKWFDERIAKKGWIEEVWYSIYMQGECYEAMGKWEKALERYLDAYQYNPKRAETLQQISKYYRLKGEYNLSYLFAKEGAKVPYPETQMLFIAYPVYDYLFDEDISISAYYTAFKKDGLESTNRLMLKKNVPDNVKNQAYKNILYYVENLRDAKFEPIAIDLPLIREGLTARYNPLNPTILKTNNGYDIVCRTVNYMQIKAEHFKSLDIFDQTNTVKTRNFLLKYDKKFQKLSQQEITEELQRVRFNKRNVEGLEDCRLIDHQGSLWFTCTTSDTNATGQPQVSLCKLSDFRANPTILVEKLIPLFGPDPNRCEKNWLPFVKNDILHMIYSLDPFIIYKPTLKEETNSVTYQIVRPKSPQDYDFTRFSGSAAPIKFDDGFLLLIHEVVYSDQRNYIHRFVFLDKDLNMTKISKPFTFLHKGIEYCCGITTDHALENLILGVGIEDREAYLCTVPIEMVRSLLESL